MTNKLHSIKFWISIVMMLSINIMVAHAQNSNTSVANKQNEIDQILKQHNKSLHLIENKGQWDDRDLYRATKENSTIQIRKNGFMLSMLDNDALSKYHEYSELYEKAIADNKPIEDKKFTVNQQAWMIEFVGMNSNAKIQTSKADPSYYNYLYGNDQSKWATDVKSYAEVIYKEAYLNTDIRLYASKEADLEYDIILKPGANPSDIIFNYKGLDGLSVNNKGELVNKTMFGDLKYTKPYAYQVINGKEIEVPCKYKVDQNNNLTFELGTYDKNIALIIDPVALRWAAYLNTNSDASSGTGTHNHGIEVDISENIYVAGRTDATNFPSTAGRFQPTISAGTTDGFVSKLVGGATVNGVGSMTWTTYLGGNGNDNIYAIKIDASNNIYLTGQTGSTNFPGTSTSSIQSTKGGGGGSTQSFVTKMNTNGTALIYSTYIGNAATDIQSKFLYVNAANEVFLVGQTNAGLTTTGTPFQASYGGGTYDGFLLKINAAGTAITYSTFYGGTGVDELTCVRSSGTSDIVLVGTTTSTAGIASTGAFQTVKAGTSTVGFVTKFNAPGAVTRQWGTYINSSGGTNTLNLTSTQVDLSGNIFLGGFTTGAATACITTGSFQTTYRGNTDLYVGKLASDGASLLAGTYVGGTGTEVNMMGINVSDLGDVYALGYTNSTDMDTTFDAVQPTNFGGNDAVFFKISADLTTMKYLTYWGGTNEEYDPVGYDGIKFSTCKIYTALTVASRNAPMTRNSFRAQKTSATNVFEAAVAVWGNPPIVFNDSISGNSFSCNNVPPTTGIDGVPSTYALSDISRNLVITSHTNVGAITYVWQKSTDLLTWTLLPGITTQSLSVAQIGSLTNTTYFRRLISNDYCPSGSTLFVTKTVSTLVTDSISINPTLFTWCSGSGDSAVLNTVNRGGTPPYSYSWTSSPAGANLLSTNIANPVAKPNVGGTYTYFVTITDSMGCTATDSVTLTVIGGPSLTPRVVGGGAYCSGDTGVSIGLNTSQVGIRYQLIINGALIALPIIEGTGGAISFGNQLTAGTYKILGIDTVTNCSQVMTDSAVIIVRANPTASAGTTLTIFYCPADSVRLGGTPTASGGTAPYTYSWSPSSGINPLVDTTASNPYVKGITSNTIYTVTVRDINTCTASSQVTVNVVNSTLRDSISASGGTTWCSGSGESVILTALVSGGTAPLTYSWSGTSVSPTNTTEVTANPSAPGTYTYVLTVSDSKGCSFSSNISVSVNTKPDSTYTVTGGGSYCAGGTGLAIGLSNTQVGVNYQLILNGITNVGTPIAGSGSAISFGLKTAAGTYTIRATNSITGCTVLMTGSKIITILPNPIANAGFDTTLVACSSDSVRIGGSPSASEGTAPYTYRWNPFAGLSSISDTIAPNPYVKGIGSTILYTLIVTDSNGCRATDTVEVTIIAPNLSVSLSISDSSWCTGTLGRGDTITANITGGTSPYSYTWSGTALLSSYTGQKVNALDNIPGTYTAIVNVIDATGCLASNSIGLEIYNLPTSYSIIGGGSYCAGGPGKTISLNSSDTGVSYQLILNDTTFVGSPVAGTGSILSFGLQAAAGVYKIQAISSRTACTSTMIGTAIIVINPSPVANAGNDTSILNCPLDSVRIGATLSSTASGGLAPYTYNWTPTAGLVSTNISNPIVTDISLNTTYKVVVTDANGCVDSNEILVSVANSTLATSILAGGSTSWCALSGSSVALTSVTTGGVTPYSYSWIGSSIAPTNTVVVFANPQLRGTYNDTVLVVDRVGCSAKAPITITVYNTATLYTVGGGGSFCSGGTGVPVTLSGSEIGVSYTLVRDGILTTTVLSGTGAALTFPNQTIAGNYTVQARISFSSCITNMTGFAIVSIRPLPTVNAGPNQIIYTCPNDSITIGSLPTAIGLNPPFTYTWTPSTGLNSTSVSNPVVKGILSNVTYTIVVSDLFGCIAADSVQVTTQESSLRATIVPFGPTSWCAYSTGSTLLFASPSGGTPPYTYLWSGSSLSSTVSPTTTPHPNTPGSYTYRLTITDSKGCIDTASLTITVNNIPDTTIRVLGGGTYCAGSLGVPVSLSSSELGVSYQLFLNGGFLGLPISGTGAPISFGLQTLTGIYSVRATSSVPCDVFLNNTVTIATNPIPRADAGPDQVLVSCNADSIRLGGSPSASGTTGSYTYYWTPNAGMHPGYDSSANPYISRIGSRIEYNLLVTDTNGCSNSDSVLVEVVPPTLAVSITTSRTTAWCESNNDSIQYTANITGGTAPYTYQWSGVNIIPNNTQVINASPDTAGSYSYPIVVTDANGCQVAAIASVIVYPLPDTSFVVLGGGTYCLGGVGPNITLSNSEVGVSYQLVLNSGINIGAPIVSIGGAISFGSQSAAGTYTVIATTANSCSATMSGSAIVVIRSNPIADAGGDHTMFDCPSDSVRVGGTPSASGGRSPYTYSWTPSTGIVSSTTIANPYIRDIDTTTLYTLTVTDSNGCFASDNVLINVVPSNLSLTISPSGATRWCEYSGGNVTLTGIVSGGRAPYSYTWSGAIPTLNPAQAIVSPQTRGTYTYSINVTDAAGCTYTTSFNVIVDPAPDSFNVTGGGAYCQGGTGVQISLDSSLVGTSYQLVYNFGTNVGAPVAGTGNAISFGLQTTAGVYTVNATTANGCVIRMHGSATIIINPRPNADAGIDRTMVSCSSDSIQVGGFPAGSGGTPPYTYQWSPPTAFRSPTTVANPYIGNLGSDTYYNLVVTDQNGCTASDTMLMRIAPSTLSVNISPTNVSWCEGTGSSSILTALAVGGTAPFSYLWSGTSISPINTQITTINPNTEGTYYYTIIVTDALGCQASKMDSVKVNSKTKASITSIDTIHCTTDPPYPLTAVPSGGTFSGIGVVSNIFYPSLSGAGTRIINYRYTNGNGCISDTTITFTIITTNPSIITGAPAAICSNAPAITLIGSPAGGTFSGTGISGDIFSPTIAGVGVHTITYTPPASSLCYSNSTVNITVNPSPSLTITAADDSICRGSSVVLTPNISFDVFNVTWNNLGGSFIRNDLNPITVSPTGVDNGYEAIAINTPYLCRLRDTFFIHVNQRPVALDDTSSICDGIAITNINVSINDSDPENDANTYAIIRAPRGGVAVNNLNGTFNYTPNTNFFGMDTVIYTICNVQCPNDCDTATWTISICSINDKPRVPDTLISIPQDSVITVCIPIADLDSIDLHNVSICGGPIHGTLISGPIVSNVSHPHTICLTYRPTATYLGTDSICLITCDNGSPTLCDTSIVRIIITPVNSPPVATPLAVIVNRGSSTGVNISPAATDPNGDPLTFTYILSPSNGTWTPTGNGTGVYTSNTGSPLGLVDSFQYVVCDRSVYPVNVLCDTSWVYVTVIDTSVVELNHPPYAGNDFATTTPLVSAWFNTLANDGDADSDPVIVSLISSTSAHGTWVLNPGGSTTYTPIPGSMSMPGIYYDTLYYSICDVTTLLPNPLCDTAMQIVTITDTMMNRAPVAGDDFRTTNQNSPVTVDVRVNDVDPDGDSITTPSILTTPSNGTVIVNPDGTVTYLPDSGYVGRDSFRYAICDVPRRTPGPLCDTAWVFITVTVNLNAVDDSLLTGVNNSICYDVRVNDTGYGPIHICGIPSPAAASGSVSYTDTSICYSPNIGFIGIDSFRYVLCDSFGNTDTATVYVNVIACSPPLAIVDGYLLHVGDSSILNVLANDSLFGNPLTSFALVTAPLHGTAVLVGNTIKYVSTDTICGRDFFVYAVKTLCGFDTGIVYVDIYGCCPAPIAVNDSIRANGFICGTTFNPVTNDTISGPVTLTVIRHGIWGTDTVIGNVITYTPIGVAARNQIDTLYYEISSLCGFDTGIIVISMPNYACNDHHPNVVADNLTTCKDSCSTINVLLNDYDLDLDSIRINFVISGNHGTATQVGDSFITYCPDLGFVGTDTIFYQIIDNGTPNLVNIGSFGIVYITVDSCNNHPPIIENGVDTLFYVVYDTAILDTCIEVFDADSNSVSGTILVYPVGDTMYFTSDSCFRYIPSVPGTYVAVVVMCDGFGGCDTVYMIIIVLPTYGTNVVAVDDYSTVGINNPTMIDILFNDTIPSGGIDTSVTIITNTVNGTTIVNSDGTVTYTPNQDYLGPDSFEYILCVTYTDTTLCDTAWVHINVIFDSLYIPNGFSPDGDGTNDYFEIPGIANYPNATAKFFNRWGDEVWDSKQPYFSRLWDGANDFGKPLPDGTYYMLLDLKDGSAPRAQFVAIHRGSN
ncbi:MAG: Ig-like domain-containing protein [Bacteroidota bacterium]